MPKAMCLHELLINLRALLYPLFCLVEKIMLIILEIQIIFLETSNWKLKWEHPNQIILDVFTLPPALLIAILVALRHYYTKKEKLGILFVPSEFAALFLGIYLV